MKTPPWTLTRKDWTRAHCDFDYQTPGVKLPVGTGFYSSSTLTNLLGTHNSSVFQSPHSHWVPIEDPDESGMGCDLSL